jgi:signal transduction histidine kinase
LLHEPALLEAALRHLGAPRDPSTPGFVDWNQPLVRPIYQVAWTSAHLAHQAAQRSGRCDPQRAWVCGLLAPLGWLALCAVRPEAVAACLADPTWPRDPVDAQERHFGVDQAGLTRRLARQWRLPDWLTGIIGHLGLPVEQARAFGADSVLFALTRLALRQARSCAVDLALVHSLSTAEDEAILGSRDAQPDWFAGEEKSNDQDEQLWQDPRHQPLLIDLLTVAAENRRLRGTEDRQRLEREVDQLHHALEEQIRGESERLQSAKLAALAEFSAGAGHEINNPLAVISGQAQYLLTHEGTWFPTGTESDVRKALQVIIGQTRRIDSILRDLMQFARPPAPRLGWIDLPTLMGEVASSLGELAQQRRVRIEVQSRRERLAVQVDGEQVRAALTCLFRNAIEAAPADGWARLALVEPVEPDRVKVVIEDSGPGLAPAQLASLFDPFYSGRSFGRGRGLGLPIAWRLARLQGGDVRLEPARPAEPTRFVLTLPLSASEESDPPADDRHAA